MSRQQWYDMNLFIKIIIGKLTIAYLCKYLLKHKYVVLYICLIKYDKLQNANVKNAKL